MTRTNTLVLSALVLTVVTAQPADGQAALLGPGGAFIGAGVSRIGTRPLNDRLAANGYPTFGQAAVAVSIGGYRILSRALMLSAEWHGLIIGEEAHEGGEVGVGAGYGTLGVGYMVELSPYARVYPRLGLGVGGLGLWIQNHVDSVGFDEVLANPKPEPTLREPVLGRDGPVIDLGAGVEFFPARRDRGVLIGLRAGYLVAPFSSGWDLVYHGKASGGPDANISGAYVRIMVGAAWSR
ncbi:MAG: hypothetical protein H0U13_10165 [Gemmatimonadaceae bacterium]|nr:hypothetical protein [Gemmatimonadaceae bacterium]